jgi:hypothetical protein
MELQDFIQKRKYLVWYVKDPATLSPEAIVEATLNYGDWEDFKELIDILGIAKTALIFRKKSTKSKMKRCNYSPKTINYFNLYFNKYAPTS